MKEVYEEDKKGRDEIQKKNEELRALNRQLEESQKAYLNIMSDMEKKSRELEESQKSLLNIMDDLERAHTAAAAAEREKRQVLEGAKAELEKRVEERTAELKNAQGQLIQSEKMAVVGQMAAGVAHELNNPLAALLTTAQVALSEQPDGSQLKEDLKAIETAALRCKKIVSNLLGFSRTHPFTLGPVSTKETLTGAVKMITNEAQINHVQINNLLEENLPDVQGNVFELQQVFVNLMLNAIQAMPQGGQIDITVKQIDAKELAVAFKDTGPGISPENLSKIFEPFFTTKAAGLGTGLGLSICSSIIHRLGGVIKAASEGQGKGATFTVSLLL